MLSLQSILVAALMIASLANVSESARILGIFPFPSPSHLIAAKPLLRELASRGHDVTTVTPVLDATPVKNYKEIFLDVTIQDLMGGSGEKFDMYSMNDMPKYANVLMLWSIGNAVCEQTLSKQAIQKVIHSQEKYDLIVTGAFVNECMLGFAHIFQAPIVQICPFGGTERIGDAVGNPYNYAYMPDYTLSFGDHMTFLERLQNTILGIGIKLGTAVHYLPEQNRIMHKYFEGVSKVPLPHLSELYFNTSLVLLNNHVSLSTPKPYLPNIVEVGGMHIKPPKKLPQDLQKFLDSAKEGVIYFSMGSNLKSAEMPAAKRDALLQAFAKLKQKVLWKWEDEVLPGQPKNVKLSKWLPQSDLLAHPNIKIFITHGGLLSTQEAMYHGVPVVGIPIFGDQQMNMKEAVTSGTAYLLDFTSINSSEPVLQAIEAVLNNPKYRENAQRISRIFRDQPQTPLETAVFWTEYVIRHKGAYHLRSAALDLTWYQYHLLDVIAVIGGVALLGVLVLYVILRTICRCICPKKKTTQGKESKKMK